MTAEQNPIQHSQVDQAVAEGGAYEVIRGRLNEQAKALKQQVEQLNKARIEEFGQAKLDVRGRIRVRTENNCIARDIVPVGKLLLFGYNVFIGLKKETKISDVFSIYQLSLAEGKHQIEQQPFAGSFLDDANFKKEFNELYVYYKEAKLIQLKTQQQTLFAVFQIGRQLTDIRVFQWHINKDGEAKYIDNRGERAVKHTASHDFEWTKVGREQHESGTHPHINILDKVFVETISGNLTIKVENNTEDGLGVYQEEVEDSTQSLADSDIEFAEVGTLILLKIRPYREKQTRYLVFNTRSQQVDRADAIGLACVSLPEDHGIIFPGGYYLQNGETKSFPEQIDGLKFKRSIRSPNGEDVMFVFYEPASGLCGLYSYNLIRKELQNPIYAHGFSILDDGTAVIFTAEEEATRIHPMQVWETPYFSQEYAAKQPSTDSFFSRIGNRELVRGISEIGGLCRNIANPAPSRALYEDLIKTSGTLFDSYFWLSEVELAEISKWLKQISSTAELVIDEFEKVEQIRAQADKALVNAKEQQQKIINSVQISDWQSPEQYVSCLSELRKQRGHLITLQAQRYIDLEQVSKLDSEVSDAYDQVSQATVVFLSSEQALQPYMAKIAQLHKTIENVTLVVEINPVNDKLDKLSLGLDLLTEILNTLKVEDATVRTQILDDISEIYAKLNQVKAQGRKHRKQLGSGEARAEFAAQFRLFSQSIDSALAMADTPENADEHQSRLLIQLEELESKFSEYDQFLGDIMTKREELHTAFESHKQSLIEQRQRRTQNLFSAATRIIQGVNRRSTSFKDSDQLNTYFASDPMVQKIAELVAQLRALDDQVRADDLQAQIKSAKEQAIRSLRDQQDIFEDGGKVIKLGRHRFSVNSQQLDLTLLPKEDALYQHLIGTDYMEPIDHVQLNQLKPYWQQDLPSENSLVSRSEFLASCVIDDAEQQYSEHFDGFSMAVLYTLGEDKAKLTKLVRAYTGQRYQEGYVKGVHDHDTVAILQTLLPVHKQAGLLRFAPAPRALAMLFWRFAGINHQNWQEQCKIWQSHAYSAQLLASSLNSREGFTFLLQELTLSLGEFVQQAALSFNENTIRLAAEYLSQQLASLKLEFISSKVANDLAEGLNKHLSDVAHLKEYQLAMTQFASMAKSSTTDTILGLKEQWGLSQAWLSAISVSDICAEKEQQHYLPEAAALLLCSDTLPLQKSDVSTSILVTNLLSEHRNIVDGELSLSIDEFNQRMVYFRTVDLVNFKLYQKLRNEVAEHSRHELQLDSFKAKPLSSFVRNQLIDQVYLPLIGDNLAKQMGALGDSKRTDLMGLLLLISPPGYGKTTIMEYVADRLGLVFMKINCPSLGHDVSSLDPQNAPNATAKQELEKLNLGLEMGNNVMLYLDDIQHTHPEFLQKFISLCDGTRRIEGVWKGQSKTYDMRGKKFCVVMAGNPYTESGDVFKIPDMLANRADIYNLGDVLSGKEQQFALSYIENGLTSNPVLAQLALRDMDDVYKLIAMAQGQEIASTDLAHPYSGAETSEIKTVLQHLFAIQEVILKVNLEYIKSAATAEEYRQEPPFKLQGSYRNMNKMAEKVSAVMNQDELMQLIGDHYVGEAQTLTSGAEENILKLALLRGTQNEEQQARWAHICSTYKRKQNADLDGDPTTLAVNQLVMMADSLNEIKLDMQQSDTTDLIKPINRVAAAMQLLSKAWSGSTNAPADANKE
jgi:hypothetical protein